MQQSGRKNVVQKDKHNKKKEYDMKKIYTIVLTLMVSTASFGACGEIAGEDDGKRGTEGTTEETKGDIVEHDGWTKEELAMANTAANADMSQTDRDIIFYCNLARMDGERFWDTYAKEYLKGQSNGYIKSLEKDLKGVKGLAMLYPELGLYKACKAHCEDMRDKNFFDHNSSDGTKTFDRIEKYYKGFSNAENIAAGHNKAIDIVMMWLVDEGIESLGHRKNILNVKSVCCGVCTMEHPKWRYCSTMDFGTSIIEKM